MADKGKMTQLEKVIKEKRTELEKVRQDKGTAQDSPERLVLAEKQERRITAQLEALERTKAAAEYRPPEPTDEAELLSPLRKYYDEKAAKVQKVEQSIADTKREQQETASALQQAAAECDTEKAIALSEKQEDLKSRLNHLQDMKKQVNALPVFPSGALADEWAAICKRVMPDWKAAVLQVETLAAEYKAACNALLRMHDTLVNVRDNINRTAEREGQTPPALSQVFTAGLDGGKLAVNKGDCIRLKGIASPITGRAL